jgi:tRNA (guanine-N7-)-methyltransferase
MKAQIRSFVIRNGRCGSKQNLAYLYGLVKYGISLHNQPWNLEAIFGRDAPTVVEIGFGMGQSLIEMALAQPENNFIGIEVHRPGIGQILHELMRHDLQNLRVVPFDAKLIVQSYLPRSSIERVQIYFPDPWPKKRHHKRRLVQTAFVQELVQVLKPGGVLHCATDWVPYAESMLEQIQACPDLVNLSAEAGFVDKPEWRPNTKFERRGVNLGHQVCDLLFRRFDKTFE